VHFDGLPKDVVPLTPMSHPAKCSLTDDTIISINRTQITVLPNFGMTDYASQGKTRPDNPVDLNNCSNHQSVYTCLSRSSSAAGTIILQGFSSSKITGGCSGFLRQEYRELELLDEITRLKYEGLIPESAKINGHRRNVLISQFRHWKGENYIPPHIHSSIAWSQNDPFISSPKANDTQWHIVSKVKRNNKNSEQGPEHSTFIMAKGTVPFSNPTSNKRKSADELEQPTLKRMKIVSSINTCPRGLQWDNVNFSCAYDALFSVLLEMWSSNSNELVNIFQVCKQVHGHVG